LNVGTDILNKEKNVFLIRKAENALVAVGTKLGKIVIVDPDY